MDIIRDFFSQIGHYVLAAVSWSDSSQKNYDEETQSCQLSADNSQSFACHQELKKVTQDPEKPEPACGTRGIRPGDPVEAYVMKSGKPEKVQGHLVFVDTNHGMTLVKTKGGEVYAVTFGDKISCPIRKTEGNREIISSDSRKYHRVQNTGEFIALNFKRGDYVYGVPDRERKTLGKFQSLTRNIEGNLIVTIKTARGESKQCPLVTLQGANR